MEPQLRRLRISHISKAADEAVSYIKARKDGEIKSLKTRFKKFNDLCMGGFEPNTIYTIGGISGSGKSALVNLFETDFIDLNPDIPVCVLSFQFEMLASKTVSRKLSYKLKRNTSYLFSATNPIDDKTLDCVKNTAESLKKYPVYYVDTPGTVTEIKATIDYFRETVAKDKWLVIIIDHLLLINSENKSDKSAISELEKLFMSEKKIGLTTIIQLAQLNRNIESKERISNNNLHYPQRSDISTADEIFHASDYIIIVHTPEKLGILEYGPHNVDCTGKIYLHFLKNREGELKILKFKNELWRNDIVDDTE